jgi:hypothetical protein
VIAAELAFSPPQALSILAPASCRLEFEGAAHAAVHFFDIATRRAAEWSR